MIKYLKSTSTFESTSMIVITGWIVISTTELIGHHLYFAALFLTDLVEYTL